MHPNTIRNMMIAQQPSQVLKYLQQTRKLDPEIADLIDCPQQADHHPEGNTFIHTCMVVDEAALIATRQRLDDYDRAVLILAALCHDFGKPATTVIYDDGRITSYDHPNQGVAPAEVFMTRSHVNPIVRNAVLPLVREHMAHVGYFTPDITTRVVKRLMKRLEPTDIHMLAYLIEADHSGRGGIYYKSGLPDRMLQILEVADNVDIREYPDPLVSGEDIMSVTGIQPSPLLGKVKTALYKAQLEGRFNTREAGMMFLLQHVVIAEQN